MATKKKVLSDQDYEEFNKMMAEYEASPTPAKIRFAHDDGSIWYEGMRGGHGDRDFVRHRLHYPAVPFSVTLDSDALNRFLTVANDEDSTVEEVFNAYVTEARKLDPVTEPIKIEDLDNAATLAFFFADYLPVAADVPVVVCCVGFAMFLPAVFESAGFCFWQKATAGGVLLRYRYRKGPLDLSFTPQYPQCRQQQTQCNQSL